MTLLPLVIAALGYGFAPGDSYVFRMEDRFEGYLPILGGNEGTVEIRMDLQVEGQTPKESERRMTCEVKDFELKFNDVKMPLELSAISDFFPKHGVDATARGKTVKTEAKNSGLPIKLPGLEQDRLADVTFLPIELPEGDMAEGQSWKFERDFGGAPLRYEATLTTLTEAEATIAIKVSQDFVSLEDESRNAVKERKDAVAEISTRMSGSGVARFDRRLGLVSNLTIESTATGTVKSISGGPGAERKLTMQHRVTWQKPRVNGGKPAVHVEK